MSTFHCTRLFQPSYTKNHRLKPKFVFFFSTRSRHILRLGGHRLEFEDSKWRRGNLVLCMVSTRLPDAVHCVCAGILILSGRLLDCLFCLHAFVELRRFTETETLQTQHDFAPMSATDSHLLFEYLVSCTR